MARLNLLVLRCDDVNATRRFYECLGLGFEKHRHGDGPEHYACETAAGVFELYPSGGRADATGVGFAVADLHAVRERLEAASYEPGDVVGRPWGLTFVVRDPDGRRVEIQAED